MAQAPSSLYQYSPFSESLHGAGAAAAILGLKLKGWRESHAGEEEKREEFYRRETTQPTCCISMTIFNKIKVVFIKFNLSLHQLRLKSPRKVT